MIIPLSRPRASRMSLGRWVVGIGLGGVAAACGAMAYRKGTLRERAKAAAARALTAIRQSSSPALAPLKEETGAGPLDTLVPGAYSIPAPHLVLDPAHASDAEADRPPVQSVFSDPSPRARPADSATDSGNASDADPWIETVRHAMEKRPIDLGYDKPEWNARLLNRYLLDIHSTAVPATRLRTVLKDLGYRWEQNRYVR